jgi:hypothetical protein
LDSQHEGEDSQAPANPSKTGWIDRSIAKIKSELQERRANKQKQSPADRAGASAARATWTIAFFTLVTVGIGISHFVAFHGQLEAMRGQLREMKSASAQVERAIDASNRQAAEAVRANSIAEKNAMAQLRAYVNVTDAERRPKEIVVTITNDGLTPARDIRVFFGWHPDDLECGQDEAGRGRLFKYLYIQEPGANSFKQFFLDNLRTLRRETKDTARFLLPSEAIEKLDDGANTICFYGAVSYSDVFNNSRQQHFCRWISSTGEPKSCIAQNDGD